MQSLEQFLARQSAALAWRADDHLFFIIALVATTLLFGRRLNNDLAPHPVHAPMAFDNAAIHLYMVIEIYCAHHIQTMFVEHQIPIVFNSSPDAGAFAINKDGNEFSISLDNPINVPKDAVSCTIEVRGATVVYVMPNISAEIGNNVLQFTYTPASPTVRQVYQIVLPDGLYSLDGLNNTLSRLFVDEGLPDDLIVFSPQTSTQTVVMTLTYAGTQVDFTVPNSINTIIGFDAEEYPQIAPSATDGETFVSQDTAKFNRVSRFLISCDLVQEGIPTNNTGLQVISSIPITAAPGSTIYYAPFQPIEVDAGNLIGNPRNTIRVRLYDQLGRSVDVLNESWDVLVVIKYKLQMNKNRSHLVKHQSYM